MLSPQFKQHAQRGLTMGTAAATVGMLGAGVAVSNMTHEAPELWPSDTSPITQMQVEKARDAQPVNVPSWNKQLSRQFDGYQNIEKKPADHIPSSVVATNIEGKTKTYSFDEAWNRSQDNNEANDLWTVGYR